MEIPLHGQFTEQDLRHSLTLLLGRQLKGLRIGTVIIAVVLIFYPIATIASRDVEVMALLSWLLPLVILFVIFGGVVWLLPYLALRQYRGSPLYQGLFSGVATDEALELRGEQSEAKTKWGAFVQYKVSDQVVLLYQNRAAASIVPRSLFASEEDWRQFQQFVRATVPEQEKAQGGFLRWRWILYLILALIVLGAILYRYLASQ